MDLVGWARRIAAVLGPSGVQESRDAEALREGFLRHHGVDLGTDAAFSIWSAYSDIRGASWIGIRSGPDALAHAVRVVVDAVRTGELDYADRDLALFLGPIIDFEGLSEQMLLQSSAAPSQDARQPVEV